MEVVCQCGQVPSRFCICQKPTKIYLCNSCINTHLSKRGGHTLLDIDVKDLFDPDLYNRRIAKAAEFKAKLDTAKSTVLKEWEQLETAMKEMYDEECAAIWKRYREAGGLINAVYQEALDGLIKAEEEIKALQTTMNVKLSTYAFTMVSLSCHPEKSISVFLQAKEELLSAMQGKVITTCSKRMSEWSCSTCSVCLNTVRDLHVEVTGMDKLQAGRGKAWTCIHCQYSNLGGDEECGRCRAHNSAADKNPADVWKCGNCGKEGNTTKLCFSCNSPHVNPKPELSVPLENAQVQPQFWVCTCGCDNLPTAFTCLMCSVPRSPK